MSRKGTSLPPPPPLAEVLLLGCEGVGKSCLVRQLKRYTRDDDQGDVNLTAAPTNGVERDQLQYGQTFVVKEIGGSMKSTWASYFANAAAIMFVVDVSNVFQLADSLFELASLLHNPALRSKPLLLVLNKIDAPGALSRSDLQSALRLDEVVSSERGGAPDAPSGRVAVVECSAAKALGVVDVLDGVLAMLQQPTDKGC